MDFRRDASIVEIITIVGVQICIDHEARALSLLAQGLARANLQLLAKLRGGLLVVHHIEVIVQVEKIAFFLNLWLFAADNFFNLQGRNVCHLVNN